MSCPAFLPVKETFFISHGSPTLSIDESLPARNFLKSFKERFMINQKPNSILVISAHWETSEPTVNSIRGRQDTIHDFNGFPKSMYQLKYPAPGSPELAKRVKDVLMASGFPIVHEDKNRGLDHGAWVPLMLMYPEADIPVCQLSVQPNRDGTYHYNLGKALASLKDEGVLIIGSGSATHNLRALGPSKNVSSWALEFDDWLKDALLSGRLKLKSLQRSVKAIVSFDMYLNDVECEYNNDNQPLTRHQDVNNYDMKAPHAKVAHPWPEHIYPLHVALGAAGEGVNGELIHHSWDRGALSYASYRFPSLNRSS